MTDQEVYEMGKIVDGLNDLLESTRGISNKMFCEGCQADNQTRVRDSGLVLGIAESIERVKMMADILLFNSDVIEGIEDAGVPYEIGNDGSIFIHMER